MAGDLDTPRHTGGTPINIQDARDSRTNFSTAISGQKRRRDHGEPSIGGVAPPMRRQTEPSRVAVAEPQKQTSSAKSLPVNSRNAVATASVSEGKSVLRPARAFTNYVEYDLSKMTDTKGGFISVVDDPTNKILAPTIVDPAANKPPNMSLADWERYKLLEQLRANKSGPFEPGLSLLNADNPDSHRCRECSGIDVDSTWIEVFACAVCNSCKKEYPEKYSLLTKTEVREDYLITDSELRDERLLRRLERPNPHKQHWNSMLLFLRYQVEEYAFGPKKWTSPEALDEEFNRRLLDKGKRKDRKFKTKLEALKTRTRTEALLRAKVMTKAGTTATDFGDKIRSRNGVHEHEWGNPVLDPGTGMQVKKCVECKMELEELEL